MQYYDLGIDIGSTTAKAVFIDPDRKEIFHKYIRHNTEIFIKLIDILNEIKVQVGNVPIRVAITGTAGMGVAEKGGIHFMQEVVAAALVARERYRETRTMIDLGGEDAKIIFFNEDMKPDIRMNGACAGGTGAFIDQMATLLGHPVEELNALAASSTTTYPIASRCGVFGKTDVQNLISRNVPPSDIAASIFRAVAFQTVNALARGFDIHPKIMFAGGPLTFQSELRQAFYNILKLSDDDVIKMDNAELIPALGAALNDDKEKTVTTVDELIARVKGSSDVKVAFSERLAPLFKDTAEFDAWLAERNSNNVVEKAEIKADDRYFIGVDSGSTTTKIVLVNEAGAVVAKSYSPNNGNPIDAVHRGLSAVYEELKSKGVDNPAILRSATTGYGEDLTHFAFKFDDGLVETIAHFRAARHFDPEVSFILDIGGQDMKAIFIKDGVIHNLELNESCSSGSGSFIETFARNLGLTVENFARAACESSAPCDLGTRCTVFMNSKVKQALREGASQGDISAGLAYSVVKNCFNKVLKITDMSLLGRHMVVQGGTFKNPAILRAVEKIVGFSVTRPDICELMGAYGAALTARDRYQKDPSVVSAFVGFDRLDEAKNYDRGALVCKGCENMCQVTALTFNDDGKRKFYTGNKCEKIFTNKLRANRKGFNMHEFKRDLLWNRNMKAEGKARMTIGIPRVLNMWDDFPFWNELFIKSGINVVLSGPSTMPLAERGYGAVMSENICFPAKIIGGHIHDLADQKPDRIFYPMVLFDRTEYEQALNQYNCPIVTGYPEVIESSMSPEKKLGIPFDKPPVAFNDVDLLKEGCANYFVNQLGVEKGVFNKAFAAAIEADARYREAIFTSASDVIRLAREENRLLILALGRPYHVDALVNHKLPEMISDLGVDIITEDAIPPEEKQDVSKAQVLTQWSFPNRIYDGALWAAAQENVEVVQLNSFGCGPDAVVIDEVRAILNAYGKTPTLIRIDEITSSGSVKLRIRSMIESLKQRGDDFVKTIIPRQNTKLFELDDKIRTIIAPEFSPFYTKFIVKPFQDAGYKLHVLPMPDRESIDVGLAYANNDICYPATIVIGDLIKALQSGEYNPEETAVCLTQTGGQCRASSYVSMLKKAMTNAGFADVPVVTITTHSDAKSGLNGQPGFQFSKSKFMLNCMLGILYGDVLARLFWTTAAREINKGEARKLSQKFIDKGAEIIDYHQYRAVYKLMEEAVAEFNLIETHDEIIPKVGIVGEIYVKFNEFSNNYTGEWLIDRGIEPEFPPLINFFLSTLVESRYNRDIAVEKHSRKKLFVIDAVGVAVRHYVNKANRILAKSKLDVSPIHDVRHIAENAAPLVNLVVQFGESWLLPGDIATFVEEGVNDVLCLQPFGCIANHVIAKGMEKKLKDKYPKLNLLFIDMDAGSSEVNIANRLSFLAKGAHEGVARDKKESVGA